MVLGSFILGNVVRLYSSITPNYGNKWLCIGTYYITHDNGAGEASTKSTGYLGINILGPNSIFVISGSDSWNRPSWQSLYAIQLS